MCCKLLQLKHHGVNLCVEVCFYVVQYVIQLHQASGGELTVDGPIWADAADNHVHICTVHLRRWRTSRWFPAINSHPHARVSSVPVRGLLASCPAGLSCRRHWCWRHRPVTCRTGRPEASAVFPVSQPIGSFRLPSHQISSALPAPEKMAPGLEKNSLIFMK